MRYAFIKRMNNLGMNPTNVQLAMIERMNPTNINVKSNRKKRLSVRNFLKQFKS